MPFFYATLFSSRLGLVRYLPETGHIETLASQSPKPAT
jgi:hypothetical protein